MSPAAAVARHRPGAQHRSRALPRIDHRYLSDAAGHDVAVVADGVKQARAIAAAAPLDRLLGRERGARNEGAALEAEIRANVVHYYHPVGTCAIGPADAAGAVVDADGSVHGLERLHVADCSIMPMIPRANTNIPAAVVGLRVADTLLSKRTATRSGAPTRTEPT